MVFVFEKPGTTEKRDYSVYTFILWRDHNNINNIIIIRRVYPLTKAGGGRLVLPEPARNSRAKTQWHRVLNQLWTGSYRVAKPAASPHNIAFDRHYQHQYCNSIIKPLLFMAL